MRDLRSRVTCDSTRGNHCHITAPCHCAFTRALSWRPSDYESDGNRPLNAITLFSKTLAICQRSAESTISTKVAPIGSGLALTLFGSDQRVRDHRGSAALAVQFGLESRPLHGPSRAHYFLGDPYDMGCFFPAEINKPAQFHGAGCPEAFALWEWLSEQVFLRTGYNSRLP